MDDIACVSRSHASLAGILASSSSCHTSFGHVKLTVFVTGTDFVAQMLLFNTCIHTYMPATGRAERLRKICGCGIKSADHYLVSGPSQRKYGEHTIALIVCREKTAEPGGNRRRRRNLLTNYLLANNLPYIHTYQLVHTQLAHTYSSIHNLFHTNPSPSLFSFLLSPCHLYLSFAACWKKLTCGVIRSFN